MNYDLRDLLSLNVLLLFTKNVKQHESCVRKEITIEQAYGYYEIFKVLRVHLFCSSSALSKKKNCPKNLDHCKKIEKMIFNKMLEETIVEMQILNALYFDLISMESFKCIKSHIFCHN